MNTRTKEEEKEKKTVTVQKVQMTLRFKGNMRKKERKNI